MINHILLAFVATFIITVVLGKIAIPMLRSLHAQQSIREEGPESHQAKAGTPTMGGAFMMVALIIGVALFAPWNVGTGMLLFLTLGHCLTQSWFNSEAKITWTIYIGSRILLLHY